ncbi:MAG: hypothetical protein ACYSTT_16600 [Planctomycetota bacterium]
MAKEVFSVGVIKMSIPKYIKQFIDTIQDNASNIHPFYRKNFRELIKFLPVIGSIIDANTMGVIEDKMLEERMANLESSCKRALGLKNAEELMAEIHHINSLLFLLVITNQNQILSQSYKVAEEIKQLGTTQENGLCRIHNDFIFVTISGPSAVGKDCVLDKILMKKEKTNSRIDCLNKFTDRRRRKVDSKYYNFLTRAKYKLLEKSSNIIFPYLKHNHHYGFDRTHLARLTTYPGVTFAIFTHFESFPTDRDFLKHRGINHIAVLLNADQENLIRRSKARLLEKREIDARIDSLKKDVRFINENRGVIKSCFDLIIDNGDGHSINRTCNKILREVGLKELVD